MKKKDLRTPENLLQAESEEQKDVESDQDILTRLLEITKQREMKKRLMSAGFSAKTLKKI